MANMLEHLQRICDPYGVKVELIDYPIGKEGNIAVLYASRELSLEELKSLKNQLTTASPQLRRVVLDITPPRP